jgi:hypothetical protein
MDGGCFGFKDASVWLYLVSHLLSRFGTRLAVAITADDMAALHAEMSSDVT